MKKLMTHPITITLLAIVLVILIVVTIITLSSPKKEEPENGSPEGGYERKTESFVERFKATGLAGLMLLLLGLVTISMGIANIITLRKKKIYSEGAVNDLENCLKNQQLEQALAICHNDATSLSKIVERSLIAKHKEDETEEEFFSIMDDNAQEVIYKIIKKPNKYLFMGAISLLLSILGTLTGLTSTFLILETMYAVPSDYARGYYEVLTCVIMGIYMLITSALFYFVIRNQANYHAFKLTQVYNNFVLRLKKE